MSWSQIAKYQEYLQDEQGAVFADWGGKVPIVLVYPNNYRVGMSSLALHGLYRWFNELPGVVCERAFAYLEKHEGLDVPLITLESQRLVSDAAILAATLSFEMDYFNLVAMLRRARIPLRAEERRESDPFVLLGGPAVSANPAVMAPLADAIVIGEAEELLAPLVDAVRGSWGRSREAVLGDWANLPGVYVPTIHSPSVRLQRQWVRDLNAFPLASVIDAPRAEFGKMHLIEVSRGCGRGCRFCLAGYWYRPPRERRIDVLLKQAELGLQRGLRIGLVGSAVSDYSRTDELVLKLREMGANFSISSLRVAPLSPILVRGLKDSGARSITLAPEAGSDRLRKLINKCVTHADVIAATELVAKIGFEEIKLYFMIGLPGEVEADMDELIELARETRRLFGRQVVVNLTPFVPKAHTPFERAEFADTAVLEARLARIRQELRPLRIQVRFEAVNGARVQAVLARGDERLGQVLLDQPSPSPARFERAVRQAGLSVAEYLNARQPDQPLPWDIVDSGISAAYLRTEERHAHEGIETAPCDGTDCVRCGVCKPEDRK